MLRLLLLLKLQINIFYNFYILISILRKEESQIIERRQGGARVGAIMCVKFRRYMVTRYVFMK